MYDQKKNNLLRDLQIFWHVKDLVNANTDRVRYTKIKIKLMISNISPSTFRETFVELYHGT